MGCKREGAAVAAAARAGDQAAAPTGVSASATACLGAVLMAPVEEAAPTSGGYWSTTRACEGNNVRAAGDCRSRGQQGSSLSHEAGVKVGRLNGAPVFQELKDDVAKMLEKLAKMTTRTAAGSQFIEVIQKLKLMLNEIEMEGVANFVYINEGTEKATVATHKIDPEWILDSGASKHVADDFREFESYDQRTTSNTTIYTADGTSQPIKGTGTVQCTPAIKLSSILHVSAFPVNLVSLNALIDQLDCQITLDKEMCVIRDRLSGRKIGDGNRRGRLWYMDRKGFEHVRNSVFAAVVEGKEAMAMRHHCGMGHVSFDKMYKVFF